MLTDTWLYHKLPVEFIPAVDCETPMWDLPERPQSYGIGTNYGDQNYHLFQVSYDRNVDLFVRKAEEILTR
jgi:hypothetical protein